ncbi:MAG TPA: gamma-glutamyltransferase [Candidatus Eisenbacteria bacterium]|nr:gamma-glutamyltransferase [Candidatus Eisenbacteria bacterium]
MRRNHLSWLASFVLLAFPLGNACGQSATEFRDHPDIPKEWPREPVRAAHGIVATDEALASAAGVEILKRGGNAVDAAVATAFALAVVEPAAGNIGGGGFMMVHLAAGKTDFFDYREVAPGKATREMYIKPNGKLDPLAATIGYRSVAVPGTVAGLALVLRTHGTMKLDEVMQPAIRLAEDGFPVSDKLARELAEERPGLQQFSMSNHIFLNDGKMFRVGDTLRQPVLAATLKRIAKSGPADFYTGETAHLLAQDMASLGGLITLDDLAHYQPKIREVLRGQYIYDGQHWEVLAPPPPSSGGVAELEALNMLRDVPLKGWDDPQSVHMVVEVMRRVFADRATYLADPDHSTVPVAGLISSCYAQELVKTIDPVRATPSTEVKAGNPHDCSQAAAADAPPTVIVSFGEGPHTTHFSVVDAAGNAVASTTTLNDGFGSHVTSSAGFLLNDEMDDFTTQSGVPNVLFGLVQSEANSIAPGKRPLSSMTPTIVLRNGKLSFVTGSPGGPTIISATLLTVLNWMRLGMDAQSAINAPRFHHQWLPDMILMEKLFSPEMEEQLKERGYTVKRRGHIGLVNAIGIDPKTGERCGAADPRDDGSAIGY